MSFSDKPALEVAVFATEGELEDLNRVAREHGMGTSGVTLTILDGNKARGFARDCGVCTLPALAGIVKGRVEFVQHGPIARKDIVNAVLAVLQNR